MSFARFSPVGPILGAFLAVALAVPAVAGSISLPFSVTGGIDFPLSLVPGQTTEDGDAADIWLPTFDPSMGPLVGWQLTLEGTWLVRFSATIDATGPADPIDLWGGATFGFSGWPIAIPAIGPVTTPVQTCTESCSVSSELSGLYSFDSGLLDPAVTPPPTDPAFVAAFIHQSASASSASGWSNGMARTPASEDLHGVITYYYTPEPGIGVMVGAGLGLLAGARRRST